MRRYRFFALLFGLCLSGVLLYSGQAISTQTTNTTSQPPAPQPSPPVKSASTLSQGVRKTVLDNGLTVLIKEVHTAPVVSVQVWYGVGSRNEHPGVNGISHQLEHMLFKGTTNRPIQFGQLFSALGSVSNAFTSYDQTAYFNTAQRDKLYALLVLEADRMQKALINQSHLSSEKQVVISELLGYENSSGYRLNRAVMQTVFPSQSYGMPVGGTQADVERLTVEQVQDYYQNYYRPDNAVLIIVGDFQAERILQAVEQIFGQLSLTKRGEARERESENPLAKIGTLGRREKGIDRQVTSYSLFSMPSKSPVLQSGEEFKRSPVILREPGSAALLEVVYPLPAVNHPDVPALDVLHFILAEGRSARLYESLVASGLVSELNSYIASLRELGWYKLYATASPGTELSQIDQVIQKTLAQIQTQGITGAELNRAKAQLRASVFLRNRDITSQGMQLGSDETTAGDYRYSDRYLTAIEQVSTADVQRVAIDYFNPAMRTVGFFEPTVYPSQTPVDAQPQRDIPPTPEQFGAETPFVSVNVADYLPLGETNSFDNNTQPLPEKITLKNGLVVLLLPDHSTPTVTLSGQIRAGNEFDPPALAGLASLTAESLMSGTTMKNALTLAQTLANRGASLTFRSFRESVDIEGRSLAADLPILIEILADVLQNATFPDNELELKRKQALIALKEYWDTPEQLAYRTLQETIYPQGHPFQVFPTQKSLKRITRDDLQRFQVRHYRPDTTVLALVGDFEPQQVRSLLESHFGVWQATGVPPTLKYPPVPLPTTVACLHPVIPNKTQSITYIGFPSIARKDPRYYAAVVLNQILGGDTLTSRLGSEIRDRLGLTYGIYSYFQAGRNPGSFLIEMQTSPEDTEQ
ncbi:MAG: insulinase family protein, partial [Coleofasciculus sp. S288]|nr:insulinase family protein [Coleofasciculus sp. S288]